MTRDVAWLAKNAAKLNANADWIVRQRKDFWKDIPGHGRLWTNGLLPPHNIWDSRRWRSWYQSNASYCYALILHAEVIAAVDPDAGRRFAKEARDFRTDLLAAVDKSLTLSPVIRVRDGTYHSFLPPFPYLRRPASRSCRSSSAACTRRGYPNVIASAESVADFRLLPGSDPRVQGYMDVLEDRMLSESFKLYLRFPDYDPQKDWFSRSGWYYQPYAERTANLHLRWATRPASCDLANQYAVLINPGAWTFREHTAAHNVMDKPVEEASFLGRFRHMLVTEEGDTLWLAPATRGHGWSRARIHP